MDTQELYEKLEKFPKKQLTIIIAMLEGSLIGRTEEEARKLLLEHITNSVEEMKKVGLTPKTL